MAFLQMGALTVDRLSSHVLTVSRWRTTGTNRELYRYQAVRTRGAYKSPLSEHCAYYDVLCDVMASQQLGRYDRPYSKQTECPLRTSGEALALRVSKGRPACRACRNHQITYTIE